MLQSADDDDLYSQLLTTCRTSEELVGAQITVVVVEKPPAETEEPVA